MLDVVYIRVLSEIALIKQFTMDLYFLISCIHRNRFTQEWDCFQSHSDDFFLFLKHIIESVKTSGEMLTVDRIMNIFL